MRKTYLLLSLVLVMAVEAFAQGSGAKLDDMRRTVEYLASQELGGRFPGTKGDTLASEFIVGKLRGLKQKPIVKAKKEKGFYHDFTFPKKEQDITTHNIIAVLPGKDKQLRNEYIVVGSHYDIWVWEARIRVRAVLIRWAFTPGLTIMPAAMPSCSNWPSILRRSIRHAVSSSPFSGQRSRDLWAVSSSWTG